VAYRIYFTSVGARREKYGGSGAHKFRLASRRADQNSAGSGARRFRLATAAEFGG